MICPSHDLYEWGVKVSYYYCVIVSFSFYVCQCLSYVLRCSYVGCTDIYHEVRTSLPFLVFQVGGCVPEYHKAVHQRRLVLKERSSSGKPNKTKPRFTEDFLFLFITLKNQNLELRKPDMKDLDSLSSKWIITGDQGTFSSQKKHNMFFWMGKNG